ncbi:MAG: dihydrodipicolinate synthase family protein, partial [Hyphomicrobiales bacterium]|nr:dihydrodipicolinate synthase family protein [Hyphomicrobiales bacterium]
MPLIDNQTRGVMVIAVTPFTADGAIDSVSLDRAIDFYFEAGADGLTVLGMMGEAPKLTQAEGRSVAKQVIERSGDRPVVVGVSSPGLAAIGELSHSVMDLGAAGVMIAPPATLKTEDAIYAYYELAVETVGIDVPVVLQDFPLATGVQVTSGVLGRIADSLPSVVMLKHEDWPGLAKISTIRAAEATGQRRLSILCGNGGGFLPEELERGADGAMTGFGYPEMMVEIVKHANAGEMER